MISGPSLSPVASQPALDAKITSACFKPSPSLVFLTDRPKVVGSQESPCCYAAFCLAVSE